MKSRFGKIIARSFIVVVVVYLLLLWPDKESTTIQLPAAAAFVWNSDSLWQQLEKKFVAAQRSDSVLVKKEIDSLLLIEAAYLQKAKALPEQISYYDSILHAYFSLAALVAAQPGKRDAFTGIYAQIRQSVFNSAATIKDATAKSNLCYRVLYGMRMATEEVLLQTTSIPFNPVLKVNEVKSVAPAATLFGVKVHSGDLLLSRGGAEVSALISRSNNYSGNFSHVALLYVDEQTAVPYLIEAHIEKGVAIASAHQYTADKKMRFMVLRANSDLPQFSADPLLPHKAAKAAYEAALKRHIPYDFRMDFNDTTAMFCSEVGSFAYKRMGIQLWQSPSFISLPGAARWLADFGVTHFTTQMPSDLEYDPQLSVVAEWRDTASLLKDHIDNAVMDALLEKADGGMQIGFHQWQLPFVRCVKAWCMLKNLFGKPAIIPEGMSATRALKNQWFVARYQQVRKETEKAVASFKQTKGYLPPYWEMLKLAKNAVTKQESN